MRVLILGGTKFIGPPAVRKLAEEGHEVTVFHRGQNNAELPPAVQHLHGDHKNLAEHAAAFRDFAPDVVLDMIPFTEQDGNMLVEVFGGVAKRLVVISSVDVYRAYDRLRGIDTSSPDPAPLTEDSPLRDKLFPYREQAKSPDDLLYQYEKILMERTVLAAGDRLPATVLRLPMVYGPRDPQHRLFPYLKRMDDGRPAILLSEGAAAWRGARGYVEDMGDSIARCITLPQAANRIYHVAEQPGLSEVAWVQRIARAAGWNGEIKVLPEDRLPVHLQAPYRYEQDWSLETSRIRTELGYAETTPPDEAMQRTVEWERANPPAAFDATEFDYAAEDATLAALLR